MDSNEQLRGSDESPSPVQPGTASAPPSSPLHQGGHPSGTHDERLSGMKRQFQALERAFHTLEGLCRAEINSIAAEQKRLDASRSRSLSRLQHHSANPLRPQDSRLVKLNIGGVRMNVSQGTLLKYPGSIFEMLLPSCGEPNGDGSELTAHNAFPITLDEEGHIFLDRDPELFRELLHFLRSGDSSTVRMLPPLTRRRVMEEAKYFGIDQLLMELRSTRLEWVCETTARSVVGDTPAPRCFASAQYAGNGTVYIFGGCTANDLFFDTLYMIRCCPTDYNVDAVLGDDAAGSDRSLNASPTPFVASYLGAGGGTTTHQQQQLYASSSAAASQFTTGDDHHAATLAAAPLMAPHFPAAGGAAGGSSGGGPPSAGGPPRPERYEFVLIRPRGDVLPPARSGHAMVHLHGHLVLLYGNDKGGHVQDVFSFNTFTQTWAVLTPRGDYVEPRSGHSATVVHGKLYLIGGKQIFPTMKSFNDIFEGTVDLENDVITWRLILPRAVFPESAVVEKRGYHSTALLGTHQIVVHGGIVKDVYCNDVCIYDVLQNTWRVLVPGDPVGYTPCQPRSGHIAVIHNEAMYVFGSYSEEHPLMFVYSFCLRTYTWRRLQVGGKGPARRAAPSGVLLPQDTTFALMPRLLLFGGFDITSRKCFNDVFTVTL